MHDDGAISEEAAPSSCSGISVARGRAVTSLVHEATSAQIAYTVSVCEEPLKNDPAVAVHESRADGYVDETNVMPAVLLAPPPITV
jgi:hypothetical protein